MRRVPVVVDTNVALVANGAAEQAGPSCVAACLAELGETVRNRQLLLDDAGEILLEYLRQRPHGSPQGAGDLFLVWAVNNQANPTHVRQVSITRHDERGYAEFPDDPDLARFDPADRKFIAVACASGSKPRILQATDTKWWAHRGALARHGANVEFLCVELMGDE